MMRSILTDVVAGRERMPPTTIIAHRHCHRLFIETQFEQFRPWHKQTLVVSTSMPAVAKNKVAFAAGCKPPLHQPKGREPGRGCCYFFGGGVAKAGGIAIGVPLVWAW
jgi:hypothetical protein